MMGTYLFRTKDGTVKLSLGLRKLRRTCWPRRHRWRPAFHWQTGEYVKDMCDNCTRTRVSP